MGEEGVTGINGDDNPIRGQTTEQGLGVVEFTDSNSNTKREVEDRGVRAPVLVGVDKVVDEMPVRDEAITDETAGVGQAGGGGGEDVGENSVGFGS